MYNNKTFFGIVASSGVEHINVFFHLRSFKSEIMENTFDIWYM